MAMVAIVLPFPGARRVDRVERVARAMARRSAEDAEALLLREVETEYFRLINLGIEQRLAEDDVIALVSAIRARLWNEVFSRPGGAA